MCNKWGDDVGLLLRRLWSTCCVAWCMRNHAHGRTQLTISIQDPDRHVAEPALRLLGRALHVHEHIAGFDVLLNHGLHICNWLCLVLWLEVIVGICCVAVNDVRKAPAR